jgi:hypothetical protein
VSILDFNYHLQVTVAPGLESLLYSLSTDYPENTALPNSGPAIPVLLHLHLLPHRGFYHAIAWQWPSLLTPLFWFQLSCQHYCHLWFSLHEAIHTKLLIVFYHFNIL